MKSLQETFDNQLSGLAWSLWNELGVAGINHFHENCLIQPEELIILTAAIADYDPRLRDEALDWLSRYHEFISVSRLRGLLKDMPDEVKHSFSRFAAVLNSLSSAKWPYASETIPFQIKISEKSALPSLDQPSLLIFRLRSLFGPGAKADLLTCFLTRSGMQFSASDLVEVGYSKRTLMTALDHLSAAGLLVATNIRNKKVYELKKVRELQVVIGKLPQAAPPWNKIVRVLLTIRLKLSEIEKSSETTKSVIFRNCLLKMEPFLPELISQILSERPKFEENWKEMIKILNAFHQGNFLDMFKVSDEFEKTFIHLLQRLDQVDDCIYGIENIQIEVENDFKKHAEVYKACYQLFLIFVKDLEVSLKQLLDFPFHRMMDRSLSDIVYQFSEERYPYFLERMQQIKSIGQITHVQLATWEYQKMIPEFYPVKQLIHTIRKRLAELYFISTKVSLQTLPERLYKPQLVLDLFAA